MNWYNKYLEEFVNFDLILRNPFYMKRYSKVSLAKLSEGYGELNVSFGKVKYLNAMIFNLSSTLYNLSSSNKVFIIRDKNVSGRKVYRLAVKMNNLKTDFFLDFFFHMIVKGLKRRYINLNYSLTNSGSLNLRFSNVAELDIDDFFFFDLYEWLGHLVFFYKLSSDLVINKYFFNIFINLFNLESLSKYEVFNRKG